MNYATLIEYLITVIAFNVSSVLLFAVVVASLDE